MADGVSYQSVVKRDNGKIGILFAVFSIIALVIFILFFNAIPILLGINIIYVTGMISFGLSYLLYRVIKNQNIEFDISSEGDNLDIIRIRGGKKREEIVSFIIREASYIGPVTSDRFNDDHDRSAFTVNCTEDRKTEIKDSNWYAYIDNSSYAYIAVFPIDDELYKLLRRNNPRNTYNQKLAGVNG